MSDHGRHRDLPRLAAPRVDYPREHEPEEYGAEDYEPKYSPRQSPQQSLGARVGRGAFFIAIGGILTAGLIFVLAGDIRDYVNVFAQDPGAPTAPSPAAAPETAFAAAPAPPTVVMPDNPIALQAQQWGITTCLANVIELARYLTANADASWRLLRGTTNVNQEMFAGSIIVRDKTTGLQNFSTMFATPVPGGRCDSGYEVVTYLPESCEQARARKPAGFETKLGLGPLAEVYATANGRGSITLMPAGAAGCIMIRTEFFY